MGEFFETLSFWHWLVLGLGLVILEIFAPGVIFLWVAIAAVAVGGLVFVAPDLGWEVQIIVFAALSVISGFAGRMWVKKRPIETDHPTLNRRGEQMIGRTVVLETAIANGEGKAKVGDSLWPVSGPDLPEGSQVTITGVDGTKLQVAAVEKTDN